MKNKKIFIFGDSFAGIFTLLTNRNLKIYRYTGATMRGLSKSTNQNRKKIIRRVIKGKPLHIAFDFGNVDLHLSYYYKKIILGQDINFDEIIQDYVDFIKDLPCENKYVIAALPSPLKTKHVIESIKKYIPEITDKDIEKYGLNKLKREILEKSRMNRLCNFNTILFRQSNKHNIKFIDINYYILNKLKLKNNYIDLDNINIHLRWGPSLKIYLKNIHIKNMGLTVSNLPKNLDEIENKYLEDKKKLIDAKSKLKTKAK